MIPEALEHRHLPTFFKPNKTPKYENHNQEISHLQSLFGVSKPNRELIFETLGNVKH